jgi:hypothetical protein
MSKLIKQFLAAQPSVPSLEDRDDEAAVAAAAPEAPIDNTAEAPIDAPASDDVAQIPAGLDEPAPSEPVDPTTDGDGSTDEAAGLPTDSMEDIEGELRGEPENQPAGDDVQAFFDGDGEVERDAAEDRAVEVVEVLSAARDSDRAVDELSVAHEGLTDVRDTLEAMNRQGGVTFESFQFIDIALNSYTKGMGVESLLLGISAESFADEPADTRLAVSLEDIDDLLSRMEKAKPALEAHKADTGTRMADVMRALVGGATIQFEAFDSEGAPMRVPAADVDADAFAAAQADSFATTRREQGAALSDAATALVRVHGTIEDQNEAGGLSTEALVAATLAMESITKPLGMADVDLVTSFEGLPLDAKTVISTEGVGDAIKAVGSAIANTVKSGWQAAMNAFGRLSGTVPTTIKRLEALQAQAASASAAGGEVSGKGVVKALHKAGQWPTDLPVYLTDYCKFASKMTAVYPLKSSEAFSANTVAYGHLDYNSTEAFYTSFDALATNWKDPRKMAGLTSADFAFEVPGVGSYFESTDLDVSYTGTRPSGKKLQDFYSKNAIKGTWYRGSVKPPAVDQIKALTKEEIASVSAALLATMKGLRLEVLKKTAGDVYSKYVEGGNGHSKVIRKASKETRKATHPEESILDYAYFASFVLAIDWGWNAASDLVKVANAFIAYASRSLTAGKVSAESHGASKVTDADIHAAEKQVGFSFSAKYSAFLKKHGGTTKGSEEFYGVGAAMGHLDAVKEYESLKKHANYPAKAMPLSAVGDGHSYAIFDNTSGEIQDWSEHGGVKKSQAQTFDAWVASLESIGAEDLGAEVPANGPPVETDEPESEIGQPGAPGEEGAIEADDGAGGSKEGDEPSMEADVKQLKSGTKVKYSHGHGKIIKVFTAPFKYKGETHQASKDAPRFECKADKGGKTSIHKASALSLV